MRSDKSRRRFVFLCVAPATILFFLFMILPTLNVFRMSLYERGAYSPNETFVGLKNFQHLLKDTQFIRSMQNMILLVVVVTIVTFAFALVFAAILTREKIKGQNFFRVIFYIPNILSVVVISGIFSAIYKPENGMLNSIIGLFRDMTDPILWKGEKLVIPSIIIAMVWQAVGYYMVMYMASMSSVPASLYESANLDGAGRYEGDTGGGFLNHMLELFARHGRFDLVLTCHGDVEVDYHHTAEDIGIALGQAFARALGEMRGIQRYGSFYLPMDEALVLCAVDLSGRCTLNWDVHCKTEKVGDFDVECASEFWLGFARNVPATLHFVQFAGENTHHILEACFKGAGHALAAAVAIDAAHRDEIPSTKGLLV